jgi:asparagine synthase (glutamine-hydrolysing)
VKTFTVGYDVGGVNETVPARVTARAIASDHHELLLTEADVAARVPGLLSSLDQPLADQALVALHAVAEFARREVTVVVGGEGADELFAGYPRYRWLARAERLGRLLPDALSGRAAHALRAAPLEGRSRRLAEVVAPGEAVERHLDWVTDGRRGLRAGLYGRRLRHGLDEQRVLQGLRTRLDGGGDVIAAFMRLDQRHWLPDDVLMKADRASMLVSLEVRTPYLHREIAEFAAAVPSGTHARHRGKALLRELAGELLPAESRRRAKTAFRVPVADWLRGPLAPVLEEQLRAGSLYQEGWFDRAAVRQLAGEHRGGRRDWAHVLWPLLALGLWHDGFRGADRR